MGALMCSAGTCVNNVSGLCSASIINVIGNGADSSWETECETYSYNSFKNVVANLGNTNYAGEIVQSFTNSEIYLTPEIECDADKCKYNTDHKCTANNIYVSGKNANFSYATQCETFIK